ncbi:hypothetical protein C3747_80g118 [Trypanosoma cruzi]|uniref:Endonuclease/exonuclease/phosphatase domain-containing protein n=1 Tax=Trypanosoma cruzi TaxID=5693 RepID=A0A2V2WSA3_TRYCR|nr:hypothetical protein C3747_80g112 [Trypanosoma cruzi]PWV09379.1 hypothetical protein C3747_80g118 [Trypanosoma cruzi]
MKRDDENALHCVMGGTGPLAPEATSFTLPGFRHHGATRTCRGSGASALVREGLRAEAGPVLAAGIGVAQAAVHSEAGMRLAFLLLYLSPSSAKSVSAGELDGPFCADGPNPMGAGANAHTEAWDRSIPSDSRGDTVAQRCIKNALQVVHTGERTRYIERRGSSALDTALSEDHAATHWAAKLSPGSDHYIVLLDALVGVDDAPVAVPRPNRTLLKWKEADWNKNREVTNQL